MTNDNMPLSYWTTVARLSFERSFDHLFEASGMSQAALAEALGVTEAYVSNLRRGISNNYTLRTLAKIARAFDGVVQINIITDGQVAKVVDYQTADYLDNNNLSLDSTPMEPEGETPGTLNKKLLPFPRQGRLADVKVTAAGLE